MDSVGCSDSDSVTISVDNEPPKCTWFIDSDNNLNMTLTDTGTGIAQIVYLELKNGTPVYIDSTLNFVHIKFLRIHRGGVVVTLEGIDFCGNSCICDPLFLTVAAIGPLQYEFILSSIDRYLYIYNNGLTKIDINFNNHSFELIADPVRRDLRNNRQYMPLFGDVSLDIGHFLTEEENFVSFDIAGPADATARIVFSDERFLAISSSLPQEFALYQNYPNPFNPSTTIEYAVPEKFQDGAKVELIVYNVVGQQVKILEHGYKRPGIYAVEWDGTDEAGNFVASGLYIYRITMFEMASIKRMLLMK